MKVSGSHGVFLDAITRIKKWFCLKQSGEASARESTRIMGAAPVYGCCARRARQQQVECEVIDLGPLLEFEEEYRYQDTWARFAVHCRHMKSLRRKWHCIGKYLQQVKECSGK